MTSKREGTHKVQGEFHLRPGDASTGAVCRQINAGLGFENKSQAEVVGYVKQ